MNEVAISFGSMGSLGATGILTIGLPFSASQSSPIQAGLDIPSVIICSKLSTNCGCLLWPLQIWVDPYSPGHRKNQCCVPFKFTVASAVCNQTFSLRPKLVVGSCLNNRVWLQLPGCFLVISIGRFHLPVPVLMERVLGT